MVPFGARRRTGPRTLHGLTSPAYDASSGFLNLLTLCSPFNPVWIFHQTDTLGIVPFEGLIPRPGWTCLSANPPPHAVTHHSHDAAGTHRANSLELDFRALAPARGPNISPARCLHLEPAIDPPLGFNLLRLTHLDVRINRLMHPLSDLPDKPPPFTSATRRIRNEKARPGPSEYPSVEA